MQTFKQADVLINIGLIAVFSVAVLINPSLLFTAYFIVGSWQLVSIVIHSLKGWFMQKRGSRVQFQRILLFLLAMVLLGQLIPPFLLVVLFLLLVSSPVLAIVYTRICYDELKELKRSHSFNLR